jgi:hypothetical protein
MTFFPYRTVLFALSFFLAVQPAVFADEFSVPPKDAPEVQWWRDSQTNLDERLSWWRDARFGMFIHWGVYSGLGNEFHGKKAPVTRSTSSAC